MHFSTQHYIIARWNSEKRVNPFGIFCYFCVYCPMTNVTHVVIFIAFLCNIIHNIFFWIRFSGAISWNTQPDLRCYRNDCWNGENAVILGVEEKQEVDKKKGWGRGLRDIESTADTANMRLESHCTSCQLCMGSCKTRGPLRTAGQNRCLLQPADLVLPDRPVGFVYVRNAVKSERTSETERR